MIQACILSRIILVQKWSQLVDKNLKNTSVPLWMFAIILCKWTRKFLGQVRLPGYNSYLLMKSHFTCIRNGIFSSSTSSARWFLILDAGSSSKCWGLNFSCSNILNDFWSHSNASWNCCQTRFSPLIFRHCGFPLSLLFWRLNN